MSQVFYRKGDQYQGIGNGPWNVDALVVGADAEGNVEHPDGWFATPWEACGTDESGKPVRHGKS